MNEILLNNGRHIYFVESHQVAPYSFKKIFQKYSHNRNINYIDILPDVPQLKCKTTNLKQVIFEITQNCNLRCKYCTFGGYYPLNRNTTKKYMTPKVAQKAIDYLWSLIKNRNDKTFTIGFYGGEPLLYFSTIKEIVEYSKNVFKGWELNFTVTTNGVLLDDKNIDYLIENDFHLWVSLDGPKENHDSKRIMANGEGSFNIIINNLIKINNIDPQYFQENVNFSIVHSKDLPIDKLFQFFQKNPLVKKNNSIFSFVNSVDTKYYENFPFDESGFKKDFEGLIDKIFEKKSKGKSLSSIENELMIEMLNTKKRLKHRRFTYTAETCLFDSRLYVDCDGLFHVCEKMNDSFPIGGVEDGFDYTAMHHMLKEFSILIKTHCSECQMRFLCHRCFIHFAKNGKFLMDKEFCQIQRSRIKRLEKIIQLMESGILDEKDA